MYLCIYLKMKEYLIIILCNENINVVNLTFAHLPFLQNYINPLQRKYQCSFEGMEGGQRLGLLLNYSDWDIKNHNNGRTRGYVVLNNANSSHKIKFLWCENKLQQNLHEFLCGTFTSEFY